MVDLSTVLAFLNTYMFRSVGKNIAIKKSALGFLCCNV